MTTEQKKKGNKAKANATSFKPGQTGNPLGINAVTSGWQPFHKRAEYLGNKYTPAQIIDIAADKSKWVDENGPIPFWDIAVLKRMAAMLNGNKEERAEIMMLLDRKEGKALERKELRVVRSPEDLTDEELKMWDERLTQLEKERAITHH